MAKAGAGRRRLLATSRYSRRIFSLPDSGMEPGGLRQICGARRGICPLLPFSARFRTCVNGPVASSLERVTEDCPDAARRDPSALRFSPGTGGYQPHKTSDAGPEPGNPMDMIKNLCFTRRCGKRPLALADLSASIPISTNQEALVASKHLALPAPGPADDCRGVR